MSGLHRARTKVAALAAATMALSFALTACSPGGGGSNPQPATGSDGAVTLTWWDTYAPGGTEDALQTQLKEYQDTHPGVTIERRFIAYADLKKSLLQSSGANSLPDIAIVNSPDHQAFAQLGIAADLTTRLAEWGQLDTYVPGAVASATLDDKVYGLPITTNCLALYYNKKMLAEKGLEPPTTWEELRSNAEALTSGKTYGLAYSAINNQQAVFQWLPTLWQAGGDLTDLKSPEAQSALEYWAGLMNDGSVSKEALSWDQTQVQVEFAQQRAAMMINGPWQLPVLAKEAPDLDYGVALLPAGQTKASVTGGENYMMIKGPREQQAWDLITWMQDPGRVAALNKGTGSLPTRSDVKPFDDSEAVATFTQQLEVARPRAYGANYAQIADNLVVALQSTLSGSASAADALATADAAVKPLLS